MYPVNAFQTGKSSVQVSAVLQLCPFNHEEGLFFPCKSLHVFIYQLSLLSSVLCVYCETYFLPVNNIIPYESTNW